MNLVAKLNRNLTCPVCRSPGGWGLVAKEQRRGNSTISELRCSRCKEHIAAKAPRPNDATSWRYRLIRREFQTLSKLQTAFVQDDQFGTVVPLGWFDGIMVTRWFDGLDQVRHVHALDAERALDACRGAGGWLRRLHDSNPDGYESRVMDVDDKLDALADRYGRWLNGGLDVAMGWSMLQRHADLVGASPVRATWSHGDFKPENLLCDGRRYVGLDIHLQFNAPVAFDIASFLDHAWLAGRSFTPPSRRHDFRRLETSFLRGYGELGEHGTIALRWAELYFALSYLGRGWRRGSLQAWYANWRMRPLIRMLAEQLRETV